MSYFPAFIKFDDKRVLIVGGGNIALEKLEHLLNFSKNITLIAKEFNSEVKQIVDEQNLKFAVKEYDCQMCFLMKS